MKEENNDIKSTDTNGIESNENTSEFTDTFHENDKLTENNIVKEVEDNGYDAGRVNIYDVKTEKSMRLAADISNASILKQIALGDSEYADIVKRQHIIIQELNEENLRLNEECRLVYEQITKQELLKELAKTLQEKKLGEREIQDLVLSEIHYSDEEIELLKERREKKKEKKDD